MFLNPITLIERLWVGSIAPGMWVGRGTVWPYRHERRRRSFFIAQQEVARRRCWGAGGKQGKWHRPLVSVSPVAGSTFIEKSQNRLGGCSLHLSFFFQTGMRRNVAHIEDLRPQHHSAEAGTVNDSPLFDWTTLVVPAAVVCTLAWVFFLFWAAVRAVEFALA